MEQLNYEFNPSVQFPEAKNVRVIKTQDEQSDKFFYQGHLNFLIPDFNQDPCDIWLSYMDFLEKQNSCEIYDQDGGEVQTSEIIDENTGLTKCLYTAYGISFDASEEPQDLEIEIEGYIVEVQEDNINYVFVATKVSPISK